jgi:hypothetical protein
VAHFPPIFRKKRGNGWGTDAVFCTDAVFWGRINNRCVPIASNGSDVRLIFDIFHDCPRFFPQLPQGPGFPGVGEVPFDTIIDPAHKEWRISHPFPQKMRKWMGHGRGIPGPDQ